MLSRGIVDSPLGKLTIVADEQGAKGIWFEDQLYFGSNYELTDIPLAEDLPMIVAIKNWLTAYFSGERPSISQLLLAPEGTDYRQDVWRVLAEVPYGRTITYKELGEKVAKLQGKTSFSAQAVGGAVGHNPLTIVIPCHRVLGSDGSLTGYAGGLERKQYLLDLEKK